MAAENMVLCSVLRKLTLSYPGEPGLRLVSACRTRLRTEAAVLVTEFERTSSAYVERRSHRENRAREIDHDRRRRTL